MTKQTQMVKLGDPPRPMLLQSLDEGGHAAFMGEGWVLQPKYDGERIMFRREADGWQAYKRSGKPTVTGVEADLEGLPEVVFDGELLANGTVVLFDFVSALPARDRILQLDRLAPLLTGGIEIAKHGAVSTYNINQCRTVGMEGCVIKDGDAPYTEGRRTNRARKIKFWHFAVLQVRSVDPVKYRAELCDSDGQLVGAVGTMGRDVRPGQAVGIRYLTYTGNGLREPVLSDRSYTHHSVMRVENLNSHLISNTPPLILLEDQ